jgi:hypothetical protein
VTPLSPSRVRALAPLAALVALLLGLAFAPPARAGHAAAQTAMDGRGDALRAEGWTFVKERDGVRVFSRDTKGSPVREVLALAVSPASPDRLMAVVSNYAAYPSFMPHVEATEVLPSPDGVTRVFQHLDFWMPIKDRAFTLRMIPYRSPHDGSRGLAWTLEDDPEYQRADAAVRPPLNDGGWKFTPLEGGTLIEYLVRSDPGGWVPQWASDMALRHSVPSVVNAVRERAVGK